MLSRITGRPVDQPTRGLLTTPVDHEKSFTEAVTDLAQRGISLTEIARTEIALGLPSLDEVFFSLTGTTAGGDPAATSPSTRRP